MWEECDMSICDHSWKMVNIEFGFTVFERCSHCHKVRTFFSPLDTWDDYNEAACHWTIVENAQSIRFDLQCSACNCLEKFDDLSGLMYCTSCMEDCEAERIRQRLELQRTFIMIAFGFLPDALIHPISEDRLNILSQYFNQRRDTQRSRIQIIPCNQISQLSLCRGEFIHDVGMLSLEPPGEREQLL